MNYPKLKIIVCVVWLAGIFAIVTIQKPVTVFSQNYQSKSAIPKPDLKEVEKFNSLMLDRFWEEVSFGMRRIQPPNLHLYYFKPKNILEDKSIEYFEQNGWKVGLFLFGKKTYRMAGDAKDLNNFDTYFHANRPLPVTKNVKENELPFSDEIFPFAAKSFSEFQNDEKADKKKIEFASNNWWFFARPVRAINESCLKCHRDYVAVKPKGNGNYEFRPRKIGDVNGILVYAFQKAKK